MNITYQIHQIIPESIFIVKWLLIIGIPFILGINITLWKIDHIEDE